MATYGLLAAYQVAPVEDARELARARLWLDWEAGRRGLPRALRADRRNETGRDRIRRPRRPRSGHRRGEPAGGGWRQRRPRRAATSTPVFPWRPRRSAASSCGVPSSGARGRDRRHRRRRVSLVQRRTGACPTLPRSRRRDAPFLDGTQAVGSTGESEGVDTSSPPTYKGCSRPGPRFFDVRPERLAEIMPWLAAGHRASTRSRTTTARPSSHPTRPARRLDPLVLGPGACEPRTDRGARPEAIGEHAALAPVVRGRAGAGRRRAPILRVPVDDAEAAVESLERRGSRSGGPARSVRDPSLQRRGKRRCRARGSPAAAGVRSDGDPSCPSRRAIVATGIGLLVAALILDGLQDRRGRDVRSQRHSSSGWQRSGDVDSSFLGREGAETRD